MQICVTVLTGSDFEPLREPAGKLSFASDRRKESLTKNDILSLHARPSDS